MIVIRNTFELKFGKAKEALALLKEAIVIQKRVLGSADFSNRILTDVTGRNYIVVLELTVPSLAAFESLAPKLFANAEWQAHYQKIVPLVHSGHREVYNVVE